MDISNIEQTKQGDTEITFCCLPDMNDCLRVVVSRDDMWQIAKYCQNNLSYAAELKNKYHTDKPFNFD